jgi:hypothetical protein
MQPKDSPCGTRTLLVVAVGIILTASLVGSTANAHTENGAGVGGDHTLGAIKDEDQPGGYGLYAEIEVNKDTAIDNFTQWAFIRSRVQLRKGNAGVDPVIQTGWQDYGCDNCGGNTPLRVFTQKGSSGDGVSYPSYSLTNHNFYPFRVSECTGDSCAKAYIYYGGSWQLLDSTENSPNCPCIEKSGTWVFLDFYDSSTAHPSFSGGITFKASKIRKADDQWYPWAAADFSQSHWFEDDPSNAYRRCDSAAWAKFTVKKEAC